MFHQQVRDAFAEVNIRAQHLRGRSRNRGIIEIKYGDAVLASRSLCRSAGLGGTERGLGLHGCFRHKKCPNNQNEPHEVLHLWPPARILVQKILGCRALGRNFTGRDLHVSIRVSAQKPNPSHPSTTSFQKGRPPQLRAIPPLSGRETSRAFRYWLLPAANIFWLSRRLALGPRPEPG